MIITTIQVRPETRKLLQLRKQERNFKNVDEAIIEALQLSGSKSIRVSPNIKVVGNITKTKEANKK